MTKRRALAKDCASCVHNCKSILASHPAHGNYSLDQIRNESTFRAGQDMPLARNARRGFYCIRRGYVRLNHKLNKACRAVQISGPGHIVGFVSCVSEAYSATALEPVTACFVDLEIFFMIHAKYPEASGDFIKWLASLLILRDDRILTLGSRTAKGKAAATLVSLASKFGKHCTDGSVDIIPPIDRRTLSELSGTVMETFSRVITELESEKILARKGRAIKILNSQALRDCMDG